MKKGEKYIFTEKKVEIFFPTLFPGEDHITRHKAKEEQKAKEKEAKEEQARIREENKRKREEEKKRKEEEKKKGKPAPKRKSARVTTASLDSALKKVKTSMKKKVMILDLHVTNDLHLIT